MRRLYVCPKVVWAEHLHCFHPAVGSHYIDLDGGLVLVSTDFASEATEEVWHSHPDVSVLPHPAFEGAVQLGKHSKLKGGHLGALGAIGVLASDTVIDVSSRAQAIHPEVRIRHFL